MTVQIDTIELDPGERIERTYWAAVHHYGFTEVDTQEQAEKLVTAQPTSVETLSYADRDAGVLPAGHGYVELRALIARPDGGGMDTPLIRYAVYRNRQEAPA